MTLGIGPKKLQPNNSRVLDDHVVILRLIKFYHPAEFFDLVDQADKRATDESKY